MEIWIDITTPTETRTRVQWPEGAVYPAVGDSVVLLKMHESWTFQVQARQMAIGTNPKTGTELCHLHLTVDKDPSPGWFLT